MDISNVEGTPLKEVVNKLRAELAEAIKDRDQALHLLMPYALQLACSKAGVDEVDRFTECGECHNCKARAFVSPIIKWVNKGWRHPRVPFPSK